MLLIEGTYLDGTSTEPRPATLELDASLVLRTHSDVLTLNIERLKISDRLGATPRHIRWGNSEKFVTKDNDRVDELIASLGLSNNFGWVARLESRNLIAITAAIGTIGLLFAFAVFGVPAIARTVALQAPTAISAQLADSTLFTIDQVLDPSELDAARQMQLTEYFTRHAPIDRLEFRKAHKLGANALTLSATTVVFTDELVELTDNDHELLAVYFHELGHARLRHVEQTILQNSAWLVLFTVMVGDFSGAGELLVSVPLVVGQMAYSRKLEREADQFAIDALLEAGLDPNALAVILQKIVQSHSGTDASAGEHDTEQTAREEPDAEAQQEQVATDTPDTPEGERWAEKVFEYLSTHPATEERLAHIRSQSLGSE